ncbi:MAG: STAS domain-containing protein [Gammaproteobacteria bacterium]|nr:STAS domain-containing protein [Gammaproteobacteria bacterium]MBU1415831.1 STAS domain-containing protein [Gammaproteobacteria bacterium]
MIEVAGDRLKVKGAMVIASAAELREAGESALVNGASVVDLTDVAEADSSAVAVLLAWTRIAAEKGQALAIVGVPQSVRSLAALYGVAELLPLS